MDTLVPVLNDGNAREMRSRLDLAVRWIARLSLILLGSVAVNLVLSLAYVHKSNETLVEVHLVYLDTENHEIFYVQSGQDAPSDAVIVERLKDWLRWVRVRPAEPVKNQPLVKALWARAFAMMTPAGKLKLEAFYREADPLLEANRQSSVEIEITEVAQLNATTYQLTWKERVVDSRNRVIEDTKWTVRLPIEVRPPRQKIPQKEARENALGITIGPFVWWPETSSPVVAPVSAGPNGVRHGVDPAAPARPARQ